MRFYEDSFNCLRLPGPGQIEKTLWAVTHVEMRRSARLRPVLDFLSELVAHASRANNYDVRLQAFEQPSF